MKRIRNIALVFFMMISILSMVSCKEDDGSGHIFKINIENNPKNLDAQMAIDSESIMIISNMMEGLVKKDKSGAIIPAATESFTMSEDGLTYTFYLKKNQQWDTLADFTAEVTADDFVFAFQRIFDKDTKSPYLNEYLCIKNASAVVNDIMSSNHLGVKAIDEYTVEFTLEYPYFDFLTLLTKTAAMPCNREFFEFTKGKYGMSAEATSSNGAFYLKEWNYDPYWDNNYIIMRRNKNYSENKYVYPYSLNFFITGDNHMDSVSFSEGDIDCYVTDEISNKIFEKNNHSAYQTKTVGLLFNTNAEYLDNYKLREVLVKTINRESFIHELPENLSIAYGIVPGGVMLQGKSYRDMLPDKLLSCYDVNASSQWQTVLSESGIVSVDNLKITVSDKFSGSDLMYKISDQWRENLLLMSTVEIVSETEYEAKISEKNFSVALVEIGSDSNSASEFLKLFAADEYSDIYMDTTLKSDIRETLTMTTLSDAVEKYNDIEEIILSEYLFVPLFYKNEYFVYDTAATDIIYHPFVSSADFSEAKYYK